MPVAAVSALQYNRRSRTNIPIDYFANISHLYSLESQVDVAAQVENHNYPSVPWHSPPVIVPRSFPLHFLLHNPQEGTVVDQRIGTHTLVEAPLNQ